MPASGLFQPVQLRSQSETIERSDRQRDQELDPALDLAVRAIEGANPSLLVADHGRRVNDVPMGDDRTARPGWKSVPALNPWKHPRAK